MSKAAIPGEARLRPGPVEVTPRRWFAVATADGYRFGLSLRVGDTDHAAMKAAKESAKGDPQALAIELRPSELRQMLAESEAWYRQEIGEGS